MGDQYIPLFLHVLQIHTHMSLKLRPYLAGEKCPTLIPEPYLPGACGRVVDTPIPDPWSLPTRGMWQSGGHSDP